MRIRMSVRTFALGLLLLQNVASKAQPLSDACKIFLDKPIFTQEALSTRTDTNDQFKKFQCSANFKSAQEAQSAGIAATIPIYGLAVPFSANWDQGKVEQWKSTNCTSEERKAVAVINYHQAVLKVDPISAQAATACFAKAFDSEVEIAQGKALRCTLTETAASNVFEARWVRTPGETSLAPKVISFHVANTSCYNADALSPSTSVSEGGVPVLCKVMSDPAAFALVTDRGGCSASGKYRMPKVTLPPQMNLSEPFILTADDVEIPAGARYITNGKPFTINARRLSVLGTATIKSFETPTVSPTRNGSPAGTIQISADEFAGQGLTILNAGQNGGQGMTGAKGSPGVPGSPGQSREQKWKKKCPLGICDLVPTGCTGGKSGEHGGKGENGYAGNPGMSGGSGGDVYLSLPLGARKYVSVLTNVLLDGTPKNCSGRICGGVGGPGGEGGPGGDGGPGGASGPGTKYCGGTKGGNKGPTGNQGPKGPVGPDGLPGVVSG